MRNRAETPFVAVAVSVAALAHFSGAASASLIGEASCTVSAEVVGKGHAEEDGSPYLQLRVLKTQPSAEFGNCDFLKIGDVFNVGGGNTSGPLMMGDEIEAGVALAATMADGDVVVKFIHWAPVTLRSRNELLPIDFHLQSEATPEPSHSKADESTGDNR